jgi:hypothetical protein
MKKIMKKFSSLSVFSYIFFFACFFLLLSTCSSCRSVSQTRGAMMTRGKEVGREERIGRCHALSPTGSPTLSSAVSSPRQKTSRDRGSEELTHEREALGPDRSHCKVLTAMHYINKQNKLQPTTCNGLGPFFSVALASVFALGWREKIGERKAWMSSPSRRLKSPSSSSLFVSAMLKSAMKERR